MADVKWIKIVTDIFDDEKILLIESMTDADSLIVIWFKLLCLAGKNNNSGVFTLNDKIPYTDEMLATIFRRNLNTVKLAIGTFEKFGMIEIVNGVITIPNWGKHQNFDKIEAKTSYMKDYMRDYRNRQKALISQKNDCKTNSKTNSKANRKANVSEADKNKIRLDIDNKNPLPEAETPSDGGAVVELVTNDKSLYAVHQKQIDEWTKLYPAVDVVQELRNMVGWLDANPSRRKTRGGMKRFINNWLSRKQDKARSMQPINQTAKQIESAAGNFINDEEFTYE